MKEIKTVEGGPETEISFDVKKKLTHHVRLPRSNGESIAIWLSFTSSLSRHRLYDLTLGLTINFGLSPARQVIKTRFVVASLSVLFPFGFLHLLL